MVNKVVVLGGGTAGWITASLIAAEKIKGVQVALVESPDIPIIGVGEGTWPSMRSTLQKIGLSERDLLRQTQGSFKQGSKFIGWTRGEGESYLHPFSFPLNFAAHNPAQYWLASEARSQSFAAAMTPQEAVINAGRAPKQRDTPDFAFNVNYGYHLDANQFSKVLRQHAVDNLNVQHIVGHVANVQSDKSTGDITKLILKTQQEIEGDLFVDCSGQSALLIGQHYGIETQDVAGYLFNDRALAVQVPYENQSQEILSTTDATACKAGWIWDIGLQSRRGVGYVFSSNHIDSSKAIEQLKSYVETTAPEVDFCSLDYKSLQFTSGYRRVLWTHNCVAVGLAAGFVEPLEASALALVEQSAKFISENLPETKETMKVAAKRFNTKMNYHWEKIVEFLKMHYVLTKRTDTAYWCDHKSKETCPVELLEKLQLWNQQTPWHDDAPMLDELFPSASYQYILYGMRPDILLSGRKSKSNRIAGATGEKLRQEVQLRAERLVSALPSNRTLLNQIIAGQN